MSQFNGVPFWREDLKIKAELQVMSDASGSLDFGVVFRGHWCTELWLEDWFAKGITRELTFLELFPILVAVRLWGRDMEKPHYIFLV